MKKTYLHNGEEYLLGSAGSLVIACEKCAAEHFREPWRYFEHPEWHTCFVCRPLQRMVPIKVNELETKWKPFWLSLGHEVF